MRSLACLTGVQEGVKLLAIDHLGMWLGILPHVKPPAPTRVHSHSAPLVYGVGLTWGRRGLAASNACRQTAGAISGHPAMRSLLVGSSLSLGLHRIAPALGSFTLAPQLGADEFRPGFNLVFILAVLWPFASCGSTRSFDLLIKASTLVSVALVASRTIPPIR